MAVDTRVFGRMAPKQVAADVMAAPSMRLTPAPAQPADLVEHPNLANYYNALDACQEILKKENDPKRRLKVEESRVFFDSVISDFEDPDTSTDAPPPTPPQGAPAPPAPAPGAPLGGSLPAAPAAPPPVPGPVPTDTTPPA